MFTGSYFPSDFFSGDYYPLTRTAPAGPVIPATIPTTSRIEIELDGLNVGWTDITDDVLDAQHLSYGLPGSSYSDRMARTGTFSFILDNSTNNTSGLQGRYSPNHVNLLPGFKTGIRVRFSVSTLAVRYYKHVGTLDSITVTPGLYGNQVVECQALDFIDEMARAPVSSLGVQRNKRSDELWALLIAGMVRQPSLNYIPVVGEDTYDYAFDNLKDENTKVLQAAQNLVMSELGFGYVKGDTIQGGVLTFESRSVRASSETVTDTFLSTEIVGLEASRQRDNVVNLLQVTTHPRIVDLTNDIVLARLESILELPANTTMTILQPYTDAGNRAERVGGIDMVSPIITVDYQMNALANGFGPDTSAYLTVVAEYSGNGVRWTITNTSGDVGFVRTLQARGRGIYDYSNAVMEFGDATSQTTHGVRSGTIDMPYQSNPSLGLGAAAYLVNLYKDPLTQVQRVSFFIPNTDSTFAKRILQREISDRISIQEEVTGISTAVSYFINAIEMEVDVNNHMFISWTLAPADHTQYWLLDVDGRSELDATTVLAFS